MKMEQATLLRIFISENDHVHGKPLFEWIVQKARENHLAGATVHRGLEGFGADSHLHTAKVLRLASDLPIIIEIIDTKEKISAFAVLLDDIIQEGLLTLEDVEARFYRTPSADDK